LYEIDAHYIQPMVVARKTVQGVFGDRDREKIDHRCGGKGAGKKKRGTKEAKCFTAVSSRECTEAQSMEKKVKKRGKGRGNVKPRLVRSTRRNRRN